MMNNQPASSSVEETPSLVRVASDELLLLGARLHDDVALGVLFDRYGTEVYAVALEMLRETNAAEAALQDAFLRIWRGVEIYDASFGTTHDWLIGIARGRSLNALARLEPFGGVPEQVVSLDDTGLLAPVEPPSGARDRLLARARAEGGSTRASEAPTVVIPVAELGSDVEPTTAAAPILEAEPAFDAEPTPATAPVLEPEPTTDEAPVLEPEPAFAAEPTTDVTPTLEAEPTTGVTPTLEVEPTTEEVPILEAEPVTEAVPTLEAEPDPEIELASEAPTLTEMPVWSLPPANGQHVAPPEEPVTQDVVPIRDTVVDAETVTQDLVPVSDEADPDEPAPAERKLAELEPSEALAAALAPIPPRRPQQRRAAPEAPKKRGIKLASIGWGAALLFVVASGLSVASWSATGPHLSPDLNVLSRLPGGRIVMLRGTGSPNASARLHSVDSGRRAELSVEGLPPLTNGRVYQVWLTEPGQPARAAGAFFVNRRGDAVIPVNLGGPVERLQAIAITQEPAPGTTAPSGLRVIEGAP